MYNLFLSCALIGLKKITKGCSINFFNINLKLEHFIQKCIELNVDSALISVHLHLIHLIRTQVDGRFLVLESKETKPI